MDTSKSLGVAEVSERSSQYINSASRIVIPAYQRANYWFILKLRNQSQEDIVRIVRFDEAFLSQANIYYKDTVGDWVGIENGLEVPIRQRAIQHHLPSFRVSLLAQQTKTIYLMMNSEQNLLTVGVEVLSPHEFLLSEQFESAAYWLFFGISLAMLIYNLFLLFTLKDKLYLYYCLYCVAFLVFAVMYSGYDLYIITSPSLHYSLVVSVALSVAFLAQFMRHLLDTVNRTVTIDLCLRLLTLVYIAQAILIAYDIHYYYVLMYAGIPTMVLLLYISLYTYFIRTPLANYALFGLSWHLLGLLLVVAVNVGFIPYSLLARYGFMIGSVVELFVFSLALAYRVQHHQASLVESKSDLYLAEYKAKLKLEATVKERTQELLAVNKKLELLSQEDGLTGLYNRRYFDTVVTKEWARMLREKNNLCLIIGDLDFFKQFNDIYGHQQGDNCLRIVSDVLKKSANRSSDTVARYGGEEFVIILPGSTVENGWQVAYKVKKALQEKHIAHKYCSTGLVTMSFGVSALIPNEQNSYELLFKHADSALYQSKNNGRNCISIYEGLAS